MALPSYARNAKTPAEHHEVYLDLIGSSQGRGIPSSMMGAMKAHTQLVKSLPAKDHAMLHKKISAHVNQLVRDDEISDDEASKVKAMYAPPTVKEGKDMESKNYTVFKKGKAVKTFNNEDDAQEHAFNLYDKTNDKTVHVKDPNGNTNWSIDGGDALQIARRAKYKRIANVRESENNLDEKKMTDAEMAKREKMVKSMKKGFKGFKQRYGERAKEVMYATATKQAMKEGAEEEQPPPGQHFCAKHVLSNVFGEGVVLDGQHAEPDENGHVEWYTVQFDHGEEVIFAEDVEFMMAEFHNNHSPSKKKMKKKE